MTTQMIATRPATWKPDFELLLKTLRREPTDRPVLYELFMNWELYRDAAGHDAEYYGEGQVGTIGLIAHAFANLGYDYFTPWTWSNFTFPKPEKAKAESVSLNEAAVITDRASFEAYDWPEPDLCDYVEPDAIASVMPDGLRMIPCGPSGVLENTIGLTGYENLCFMLADQPDLARDVFDAVGSRLLRYYQICLEQPVVGAIMVNDDWGFKTQPMLAPEDMRRFVFPWHRRIVEAAHEAGKPAILHSCGNPFQIIDDIIDVMRFDAKHSYEDEIVPPERAWDLWGDRIAVLGGMDVDFLCRSTPEQVRERARQMLARSREQGGYALGSGNSIPTYIPRESYFAMLEAAWAGW